VNFENDSEVLALIQSTPINSRSSAGEGQDKCGNWHQACVAFATDLPKGCCWVCSQCQETNLPVLRKRNRSRKIWELAELSLPNVTHGLWIQKRLQNGPSSGKDQKPFSPLQQATHAHPPQPKPNGATRHRPARTMPSFPACVHRSRMIESSVTTNRFPDESRRRAAMASHKVYLRSDDARKKQ